MSDQEVKITLIDANAKEQEFDFEEPQLCIVGRAQDCDILTPDGEESLSVSRHHCLLEIDPPSVRVHDLGSTNGTFVNGVKIPRGRSDRSRRSGIRLHNGDEVSMGPVRLKVHVPQEPMEKAANDFALEFGDLNTGQDHREFNEQTLVGRKSRDVQNEERISEPEGQRENARN